MKPGSKDKPYPILIAGRELEELKKFTWHMMESFGLDQRIEDYKGSRPIGFYRWDLDCLEAVTEFALEDKEEYPDGSGPRHEAMKQLCERIKRLRAQAYADMGRD